jgi:hypothetical protein
MPIGISPVRSHVTPSTVVHAAALSAFGAPSRPTATVPAGPLEVRSALPRRDGSGVQVSPSVEDQTRVCVDGHYGSRPVCGKCLWAARVGWIAASGPVDAIARLPDGRPRPWRRKGIRGRLQRLLRHGLLRRLGSPPGAR